MTTDPRTKARNFLRYARQSCPRGTQHQPPAHIGHNTARAG